MRIKPKKRLGQNFLTNKTIQHKITKACAFSENDTALEIGAGRGEMTHLIAPLVSKLYAVEIDSSLCIFLQENLVSYPNVEIIHQDILKLNFEKYFSSLDEKIKVIGNIPYYITTPIIELLLENKKFIDTAHLTVQKEFAKRMVAKPGSKEYGSLSCFVQYYTDAKITFFISKGCFFPQPKVDSCLLMLAIRQEPAVSVKDESHFFKIIRTAFNQRRKTLKNSLKGVVSQTKLELFFNRFGITPNIRPEDLGLEDFARLENL